jgi:transcriptional regulator with AAA-type ATPase domain
MVNITRFDENTIEEWSNAETDYSRNDAADTTDAGDVWSQDKPKNRKTNAPLTKEGRDARSAARKAIVTFLENFHYIKDSTSKTNVKEMLDEIRDSKEDQQWLYEYFGISIGTIDRSLASGGLSYKHLEIALNS